MARCAYLQTGQRTCHDTHGTPLDCRDTGQDAEFARGAVWPVPRFAVRGELVEDVLTGLVWPRDANLAEYPLNWYEAFGFIADLRRARALGFDDWRLPNRRELRSLVSHATRRPALPQDHPFTNVFPGWYWTSTSAVISPAHAWYVHMDGGRMFYGGKDQSYLVWPVRATGGGVLPATGQTRCYDSVGRVIACPGSGQDGELRCGCAWPGRRFSVRAGAVADHLTGLLWSPQADVTGRPVGWEAALAAVAALNRRSGAPGAWRLPNINELESLVDAGRCRPALPAGHPFAALREVYWSSTTSMYEPDWAWALYLDQGAVGVGHKTQARFHVWAVSNGDDGRAAA